MSGALVGLGLLCALYVWLKSKSAAMTTGVLYFVLMELLQFFQYYWIDQCDNAINQWLTVVGFLHICFQPYFTHLMNGALVRHPEHITQFALVRKLALLQGAWMFSRWVLAPADAPLEYTEWLRGDKLCTLYGNYHISWSLPLLAPTYFSPSNAIHFFMMFAPFLAMGRRFWLSGLVLFATGPLLAWYITPNLYEQAAIWCFMSIGQIVLLVLMLQFRLGGDWTRVSKSPSGSPAAVSKPKPKAPTFTIGRKPHVQ